MGGGLGPGLEAWLAAQGLGGSRPGNGGISRGRADAFLGLTNDTQGGTDAFQAERLPPGQAPSRSWARLGTSRGMPETNPVRDTGPGSAGAQGSGEASTRRRLAPRHREAVKRFFSREK